MAVAQYYGNDGHTHFAPSTTFSFGTPLVDSSSELAFGNSLTGPAAGYSIHLFPANEDGFSPSEDGSPPGGAIGSVMVRDDQGIGYFTLTGPFSDSSVTDFWNTLETSGAKAALDELVGTNVQLTGSGITDYVETYGQFGTYDMEGGSSYLAVSYDFQTVYADGGTDTITILKSGFANLFLSARSPDPVHDPVQGGQPVTIDFAAAGTLSFNQSVQIDGFGDVHFVFSAASGGQFIYLTTNNLPPAFDVQGSSSGDPNEIVILPEGNVATTLNLSNVAVTNFSRLDQAFVFDFRTDTQDNSIVGVPDARNVFEVGGGNNTVHGGSLADIFEAGPGHDLFFGGAGADMAVFDGASTHFHITKIGPHRWKVHDNRPGSPDGTVTLVKVEYLSFTNHAPIFIGGSTSAASVQQMAHTHAVAAHSVFDLHA